MNDINTTYETKEEAEEILANYPLEYQFNKFCPLIGYYCQHDCACYAKAYVYQYGMKWRIRSDWCANPLITGEINIYGNYTN